MADVPPPPLEYQQDPSLRAIRRGVRLLVLLTLVNTVLLGAGFFAPAITAVAREQWAAYQKSRADAAAAVQAAAADRQQVAAYAARESTLLASQAAALSHLWPAGTLVFAEDFAIGTLPAVGTTSATMPAKRNPTTRGSAAAAATRPAFFATLSVNGPRRLEDLANAFLFIHGRRARPDLPTRLVVVSTRLEVDSDGQRRIDASAIETTTAGSALKPMSDRRMFINLPRTVRRRGDSEPPALRFFAGTPDPVDDASWTICYEFGAGQGTIAMRLRADDEIEARVDGPLQSIMPQ